MAVAALVCGIAGIFLFFVFVPSAVALVLGLIAASRAKRTRPPGPRLGMARAGWILGAIGVALFALIVILAATGVIESDDIGVTDLEEGDCVDLRTGAEIRDLPRRDCDEAHDGEVFLVADVSIDTDEYPGLPALAREIDAACSGVAFQDYVGVPYLQSELEYSYLYPVEDGWDRGDREFVCIAVEADGSKLIESIQDRPR
jgi:hypothetical protein